MLKRIDVAFTLKSPVHIGYLPNKGSVIASTRYYIPSKNIWGAITKRATEKLFDNPKTREYRNVGKEVMKNFRFSYFYIYDGETIYLPAYTDEGIKYGDKNIRDFEHNFIGSRVLTAMDHEKGTAKYGSFHEIEFIKNKFRDEGGNIRITKLIGCIWGKKGCKLPAENGEKEVKMGNGIFVDEINLIETLILGGEQNYGFGVVELESVGTETKFPIEDNIDRDYVKIKVYKNEPILSHFEYDRGICFKGEVELLGGRGYFDIEENKSESESQEYKAGPGAILSNTRYCISPGSIVEVKTDSVILLGNGIMKCP
ncbi:MAG: RAMP superfamily CRISPR-associated protein [Candidatus Jordarchaeum sp.]|uniref:RAMP superfamily CRISPR-associated protein n=1 Tax=Candidatus Jordarchaeum sp. TaxID=2823881 RepID=UPI0040492A86